MIMIRLDGGLVVDVRSDDASLVGMDVCIADLDVEGLDDDEAVSFDGCDNEVAAHMETIGALGSAVAANIEAWRAGR